jgi:hypothetical protein
MSSRNMKMNGSKSDLNGLAVKLVVRCFRVRVNFCPVKVFYTSPWKTQHGL